MNMKRLACILLSVLALGAPAGAKVVLHHLVGDNMVLQQQTRARVWGKADPGKTVRVVPSWSGKTYTAKAGKDGAWEVFLDTPAAGMTPYEITFSDGTPLKIGNVLIGEVWVAGGQSNMEMPVRGFGNCPVDDYNDVVAESAAFPAVRYAKIPSVTSMVPLEDADTKWNVISPETVPWASAVGYFFARRLFLSLGIPVGIIEANKGGTRVEGWLSRENLEKYTREPLDEAAIEKAFPGNEWHRPLVWGNGTFNPVLKYTVKGILFYQGCSNVGNPGNQYSERLALLVRQWRDQFGLGEIPFHFVQICPFGGTGTEKEQVGTWVSLLQEQQFKASREIPNSALVCTMDCVYPYEVNQIHPAAKKKVGERLAYLTLNRTYGMTSFAAQSPSYRDMEVRDGRIYVSFDNMEGGMNRMYDIRGFEIAGEDRVFHKADAVPEGNRLRLSSPEVPAPVAVRYAFHNWPEANFGNGLGLPLFPFRSDDW